MRKIRALVALTTSLVLFTACAEDGNHASNADNAINNGSADGSNNGSGDDGNDGGNDGGANNGSNNGGDDGGGDDGGANNGANNGGNTDAALAQYTPDQANWDTFATKPVEGGNPAHDPDSVSWIKAADWADAEWDGTIYNPSKMSRAELAKAICPSGDRVRGLRKVFYDNKPFADNANPTKAEVDEWHRLAINHVRALVGYTSPERQVKKDHCMFARALWGDERKFTTKWDDKYPGTNGSAFGPCQGSSNAHCGATFIRPSRTRRPISPLATQAAARSPALRVSSARPSRTSPGPSSGLGRCAARSAPRASGAGTQGPGSTASGSASASGTPISPITTTTPRCARSGAGA